MKRARFKIPFPLKKQKTTAQPKEILSLKKLAAMHIHEPLLREIAQNDSVEVLMGVAAYTVQNITVKGRVAHTPQSFTTNMANYPKLRVDSLDVPEFWFEFDPEYPAQAQGRLCCFKADGRWMYKPETYTPEESKKLIRALQQDARYEILPRRGSCLYSLQRDGIGRRWFRYDCVVHPSTWLEISIHD